MKSDKKQTTLLISMGLIIMGAIVIAVSFGMPKVYNGSNNSTENNILENNLTNESSSLAVGSSFESNYSSGSSNNNVLDNNLNTTKSNSNSYTTKSGSVSVSFPLNLNSCTSEELQQINGLGETRANSIIAYRDYLGGYSSIEQLMDIKGIGEGLFEKIAPYVTV